MSSLFTIRKYTLKLLGGLFIITMMIAGCDTTESVTPRNTDTFIRLFGGEFQDKGVGISILPDNRVAILASTTESVVPSGEEVEKDVVIILADTSGTYAEMYAVGYPDVDETPSGMVYNDGMLYVGGTTNLNGNDDFLFLKFSVNSNSVVSYLPIGFRDTSEVCHDIGFIENVNGSPGIIMVGEIGISDTTQSFDTWVTLDGDSIGSLIPSARFDGRSKSVVPMDQFNYLTLGEDQSQGPNSQIIKLSRVQYSNGVAGDSKDLTDAAGVFNATKLLMVSPDIVLANGYESSFGVSGSSAGVLLSENQTRPNFPGVNGKEYIYLDSLKMITTDIIKSVDNGYLLLGTDTNRKLIKLVKLNSNLDLVEWSEVYGTNGELEQAGSVCQFPDGKIFFTATVSYQAGGTNTKIALFKTTSNGKLDY